MYIYIYIERERETSQRHRFGDSSFERSIVSGSLPDCACVLGNRMPDFGPSTPEFSSRKWLRSRSCEARSLRFELSLCARPFGHFGCSFFAPSADQKSGSSWRAGDSRNFLSS